jgi:hypothetical protein
MGKLTAQEIKNVKPGPKQQKLTDGEGMYLLVTKTGKLILPRDCTPEVKPL